MTKMKQLRLTIRLSQKEFAALLKVPKSTFQSVELGRKKLGSKMALRTHAMTGVDLVSLTSKNSKLKAEGTEMLYTRKHFEDWTSGDDALTPLDLLRHMIELIWAAGITQQTLSRSGNAGKEQKAGALAWTSFVLMIEALQEVAVSLELIPVIARNFKDKQLKDVPELKGMRPGSRTWWWGFKAPGQFGSPSGADPFRFRTGREFFAEHVFLEQLQRLDPRLWKKVDELLKREDEKRSARRRLQEYHEGPSR